jgi:hypothetical protein
MLNLLYVYVDAFFILILVNYLLNVALVLPVHFSYFTPTFISDSWGYETKLLALSGSRLKKLRSTDIDNYVASYVVSWLAS